MLINNGPSMEQLLDNELYVLFTLTLCFYLDLKNGYLPHKHEV